MDKKYSTRSNFLESVAVDNFMRTRLDKNGCDKNGKYTERTKSEKVKAGYMKRINQTLVLRRKKKIFLEYLK